MQSTEVDPKRLQMMTVAVFSSKTTKTSETPKFEYMSYNLAYPGLMSVSIPCDEADKKIKAWKKQGYSYSQCKWFLWAELTTK